MTGEAPGSDAELWDRLTAALASFKAQREGGATIEELVSIRASILDLVASLRVALERLRAEDPVGTRSGTEGYHRVCAAEASLDLAEAAAGVSQWRAAEAIHRMTFHAECAETAHVLGKFGRPSDG